MRITLAFLFAGFLVGCEPLPPEAFCPAPLPTEGQRFSGPVAFVTSGRNICIGSASEPKELIPVTIAGRQAPNLYDTGGRAARAELVDLTRNRVVSCVAIGRDKGSVLARCDLGGENLAN